MIKKLILPLSLALVLVGCSKKDKIDGNAILGKWQYDREVIYSGTDGKELNRNEGSACDKTFYKEFLSGGVLKDANDAQAVAGCGSTGFGPDRYKYDVAAKK